MRLSKGLSKAVLALAILALAMPLAADTDKNPQEEAKAPEIQAPASFASSGMIAHIDSETGELRMPTAEEMAKLQAIAEAARERLGNISARAITPVYHANGMVSAELDPAFHDYTIVRIDADGKLITDCVDGLEEADKRVLATQSTAPAPREEQ